jgi:hypothetical protein
MEVWLEDENKRPIEGIEDSKNQHTTETKKRKK